MNLFDSDNLDRGMYDNLEQMHTHESLDWSDNVFGESIPGEDDDTAAVGDEDAAVADEDVLDDDAVEEEDTVVNNDNVGDVDAEEV